MLGLAITMLLVSISWQLYARLNVLLDVAFPLFSSFGGF